MLKSYPAIFHKGENGYWVEFTEFQGGAMGDTLEEAMAEAKICLAGLVAYYIDENIELPKASNIRSIELENDDDFTTLIQVDPMPYIRGNKTVRKNVTVPEWLVKKAEKANINFSKNTNRSFI